MAVIGISSVKPQKKSRGITTVLASAFLEWLLICMILVNAVFSYFITKFASCYGLQTPCLLCSRLDHISGSKRLKQYWDLICGKHMQEISSLVYCHAHNKLVDVHGMCEACLFSFATMNKTNAETYRLLVSKLGEDSSSSLDHTPLLKGHSSKGSRCSCCNEVWMPRGYGHKLMQTKSIGSDVDEDMPSSDNLITQKKEKQVESDKPSMEGTSKLDTQSCVTYKELRVDSGTELKDMFFDFDENLNASSGCSPSKPINTTLLGSESKKLTLASSLESSSIYGHGLEQINWQKANGSVSPTSETKQTLFEELKRGEIASTGADTTVKALKDTNCMSVAIGAPTKVSEERKLISLADFLPSSNGAETPVEGLKESVRMERLWQASAKESKQLCKEENESNPETEKELVRDNGCSDISPRVSNSTDHGDAYKLAISKRGRELSEQLSGKDFSTLEELKLLLSQLSAAREQPMNDTTPRVPPSPRMCVSPRFCVDSDDLKNFNAFGINGMQIIHKRIPLERSLSGQSLDGLNNVNDVEGETVVDRLRRQVEHDKKLLSSLYKELEEERSASAVAVNQVMAMISKLQEEKATLQMEALQCLRMMEEQAEYDMEALQKTNELLAEREKEIQDLDAELEYYRTNFPGEPEMENTVVSDMKETSFKRNDSILEFEDEKLYIRESLKTLEKKLTLTLFSNNGSLSNFTENTSSANGIEDDNRSNEVKKKMELLLNSGEDNEFVSILEKENMEVFYSSQSSPLKRTSIDQGTIVNEIQELNKRLKMLEEDNDFIEHSINAIKNGDDGVRFVQEIASDLRELRRNTTRTA